MRLQPARFGEHNVKFLVYIVLQGDRPVEFRTQKIDELRKVKLLLTDIESSRKITDDRLVNLEADQAIGQRVRPG